MNLTEISVIGGLTISALAIIGNVLSTWITKKYEYERETFRTILDCAYKEWDQTQKLVKELSEKTGRRAALYPFTSYLIFYNGLYKLLKNDEINDESKLKLFMNEYKKAEKFINENVKVHF